MSAEAVQTPMALPLLTLAEPPDTLAAAAKARLALCDPLTRYKLSR
jgi:hypothetical protein